MIVQESSRMKWVEKYSNLIVLRTFSKSAGLAGIRVGYGAFPLDMIPYIWRAKQPYNVSVASETAACAALTNKAYLQVPAPNRNSTPCRSYPQKLPLFRLGGLDRQCGSN
jgi:histidinol-phosphate/aromatic aminotransferase/cobyric acid decarboxylase-like protein